MNDPSQMMNRNFPIWPPAAAPPPPPADPSSFQTPRPGWVNWKGKKAADKRKKAAAAAAAYQPPALTELQRQNRVKARRFYPKKKHMAREAAPTAPRNTTSFIIRAKKAGGIPSLVSPCPVTPAILPTPKFSPSREGLVDMVKEEWGVDGYGSMKGLIRLRPGGGADEIYEDAEEGSSETDADSDGDVEEQHLEVERRLDHDLSRFEMVYPNLLENRVDDQDTHIAQLEEENLEIKGRMFLLEREMGELRRRVMLLERARGGGDEVVLEVEGGEDVSSGRSVGYGEESNEIGTPMHD